MDFDITNIQDYMTNEVWETLQQLGMVHYTSTILSLTQHAVTTKHLEWMCSHCQLSTTHRNMLECDDYCRWFHW